jgi:hypothetical protein
VGQAASPSGSEPDQLTSVAAGVADEGVLQPSQRPHEAYRFNALFPYGR